MGGAGMAMAGMGGAGMGMAGRGGMGGMAGMAGMGMAGMGMAGAGGMAGMPTDAGTDIRPPSDAGTDVGNDAGMRNLTTVLPLKSTWKYLDDGTDQKIAWKEPAFADAAWKTGPAPLGYGDDGKMLTPALQTKLLFGADATMKFITTYFRTTFMLTDLKTVKAAVLEMAVDDGAVVYINGVEVARINMPADVLDSTTLSTMTRGDTAEISDMVDIMPLTALKDGMNVIAVEVHQGGAGSSDIIMDLALKVERTAVATDARPSDAADAPASMTDAPALVDAPVVDGPATDASDDAVDATTG
jgi:hypothetical protein